MGASRLLQPSGGIRRYVESCIALWLPIEREDIPIAIAPLE